MALRAASAVKKVPTAAMMIRFQSTLMKGGDEAQYIFQQEEKRKEQLRANLEKILAMYDENPEKQEIIEKLCELRIPLDYYCILYY